MLRTGIGNVQNGTIVSILEKKDKNLIKIRPLRGSLTQKIASYGI